MARTRRGSGKSLSCRAAGDRAFRIRGAVGRQGGVHDLASPSPATSRMRSPDGSPHRCGQEPGTSSALCCWLSGRTACSPMLHSSPSRASQGSGAHQRAVPGAAAQCVGRAGRGGPPVARVEPTGPRPRRAALTRLQERPARSLRELQCRVPASPRPQQANAGKLAGRHQGHRDGPNVPCIPYPGTRTIAVTRNREGARCRVAGYARFR